RTAAYAARREGKSAAARGPSKVRGQEGVGGKSVSCAGNPAGGILHASTSIAGYTQPPRLAEAKRAQAFWRRGLPGRVVRPSVGRMVEVRARDPGLPGEGPREPRRQRQDHSRGPSSQSRGAGAQVQKHPGYDDDPPRGPRIPDGLDDGPD